MAEELRRSHLTLESLLKDLRAGHLHQDFQRQPPVLAPEGEAPVQPAALRRGYSPAHEGGDCSRAHPSGSAWTPAQPALGHIQASEGCTSSRANCAAERSGKCPSRASTCWNENLSLGSSVPARTSSQGRASPVCCARRCLRQTWGSAGGTATVRRRSCLRAVLCKHPACSFWVRVSKRVSLSHALDHSCRTLPDGVKALEISGQWFVCAAICHR